MVVSYKRLLVKRHNGWHCKVVSIHQVYIDYDRVNLYKSFFYFYFYIVYFYFVSQLNTVTQTYHG